MKAWTQYQIRNFVRLVFVLGLFGIFAISPAIAQRAVPEGTHVIEHFGANAEIHFVQTASSRQVQAYLLMSAGQCKSNTRLETAMCEILDKDGPQVRRITLNWEPPRIGGAVERFSGSLDFAGVQWSVRLTQGESNWRIDYTDASIPGHPVISVSSMRQIRAGNDNPPSRLAGNWQADFGSVRIEASLSANGARAVRGQINIHPATGTSRTPPGSVAQIWPEWLSPLHKAAIDHGPLTLEYAGDSGGSAMFSGRATATASMEQNGWFRIISAGNGMLIAELRGDFDTETAQPFIFTSMTGSLTPVTSSPVFDFDGRWTTRTAVSVGNGNVAGSGLRADLAISADGTRLELDMGSGGVHDLPLTIWTRGTTGGFVVSHAGHVPGPNGQTVSDWVGDAPMFATARVPGTTAGTLMLLVNGDRAVMLADAPGGSVYTDIITYSNFNEAEVYFLERTSRDASAPSGGVWQGQWDIPAARLMLAQDGNRVIGRLANWSMTGWDAIFEGRLQASGRTLRGVLYHEDGEIGFVELPLNGDNLSFDGMRGGEYTNLDRPVAGLKDVDTFSNLSFGEIYWPTPWNGTPPTDVARWLGLESNQGGSGGQERPADTRPTDIQAGIELPGFWTLDGTGLVFDIVVELPSEPNVYPVFVVASRPKNGDVLCGTSVGRVIELLCQLVAKDGPVLLWGDVSRIDAGHLNNTIPANGAQFSGHLNSDPFDTNGVQIGFTIRPDDPVGSLSLSRYQTETGPTETARHPVRKIKNKFTPLSAWADGNWRADYDTMAVEAAISSNGPVMIDGTVQFVPGTGFRHLRVAKLYNFAKIVDLIGYFHLTVEAHLDQLGSFFEGSTLSDLALYPDYSQNAIFWFLPLENDVMIMRIDNYSGSPDGAILLQRSGPITPRPAVLSEETGGTSATDARLDTPKSESYVGDWAVRRLAIMSDGGNISIPDESGIVSISPYDTIVGLAAANTSGDADNDWLAATSEYWDQNREYFLDFANRFGALGGQTAAQWIGDRYHWYASVDAAKPLFGPDFYMMVGDERAVLISAHFNWAPFGRSNDFRSDARQPDLGAGRIYFLERIGGHGLNSEGEPVTASGGGNIDAGNGGGAITPVGQLGVPPSLPSTGAAALVWGADLGNPCPALMNLENALWSGAADGSVALDDVRALSQIMYPAGVRSTGMTNDAECRNVLIMLQAEMAQRIPQ